MLKFFSFFWFWIKLCHSFSAHNFAFEPPLHDVFTHMFYTFNKQVLHLILLSERVNILALCSKHLLFLFLYLSFQFSNSVCIVGFQCLNIFLNFLLYFICLHFGSKNQVYEFLKLYVFCWNVCVPWNMSWLMTTMIGSWK